MSATTQLGKPSALALIVISVIGRLIPHPANFTPLGATALFGGSKLERPWNYLAPLFVLFVTDLIIGLHGTMPYVYGAFVLNVWLGERLLSKRPKMLRVAGVGLTGAVMFFIISNFGVWMEGVLYPKTLLGLIDCYIAALPFFTNTLAGDLIFAVSFFALYQFAENRSLTQKFDKTVVEWLVVNR
ncbi:MAG: hypothetical protein HZB70_00480 [Candidatus Berkelbacteria bacterium]|nr:MAG: hypothetical protein HZB70_00480 [Candidatus Berkelbacteria bacterium]QQG51417.1 MAG: hypothetical protein HY845_02520 [Candidatus Berkelbacteria bacterium]